MCIIQTDMFLFVQIQPYLRNSIRMHSHQIKTDELDL